MILLGQFERTLLHSFHKGASFRQWLLRPDCPPMLEFCRKLLDKAYGYAPQLQELDSPAADSADSDEDFADMDHTSASDRPYSIPKPPASLCKLLKVGSADIKCFSRVAATKGYYAIPSLIPVGNSYVCFRADNQTAWVAGQIQHIFEQNGQLKAAIKRSVELAPGTPDPFLSFWGDGFEAKMVSSEFSRVPEIVDMSRIVAHTARWELADGFAVVLNLSVVGAIFSAIPLQINVVHRRIEQLVNC